MVQTFTIKYALSQLSEVIQMVIGPPAEVTGLQAIGTPGLEELYQGQFDNTLLAYMAVTDPIRQRRAGAYGYLEHWEQGSGSAWTISSALTLREGLHKTRPYQSFKVQVRNGGPHTLYYDYDLGTRVQFEIDGILHADQITAVRLHYDETTPKTFDLSIGDDREASSPLSSAVRSLSSLWSAVGLLFGSGDIF